MPREDEHAKKARQNELFSSSLDRTDETGESWAVISDFYAALHYVQSYLVRVGAGDCDNHAKRLSR